MSGKVCGPFWSFFWGVVAPWIVTAFFYETSFLVRVMIFMLCISYDNIMLDLIL
jgi:hypothetical protein